MAVQAEEGPSFTAADRIRQLNDIDKDVAKLIHSAGLAVQALTDANPEASSPTAANGSLEFHKKQFKEATQQYFALLSSIDVRLRRQVYAAEEAELPPSESVARAFDSITTSSATGSTAGSTADSMVTDLSADLAAPPGGFNMLNVSWLNSRKDTVRKDKEAELWAAARAFMEELQQSGALQRSGVQNGEHEKMQVD